MFLDNRFNQHIQLTFHHFIQTVERQVDAVIGNAPLREVVSTVTVAAIATPQQVTTGRRFGLLPFCHFCSVDTSTKYRKCFSFVFML
ncbi:Uncharacterised protein [Shigella sonnei]|nr:Uncharacterised protein [Shigella sonnei]